LNPDTLRNCGPRQTPGRGGRAKGREGEGQGRRQKHGEEELAAKAAETSAGVLPVKGHGEPLPEQDRTNAFSLELAGSQSRSFGKLRPNAPGGFTPATAYSLDDHGDKREAIIATQGLGVLIATLEILIPGQGSVGVHD
jgi:hypothetical protein